MKSNRWQELSIYQSHDLLTDRYKKKHGRTLNATRARQIASHFIQAEEYFKDAARSDDTVKPLVLYYGVLSLSRGTIIFLDPRKNKESLVQKHGLSMKDWSPRLLAGDLVRSLWSSLNISVSTTVGTFTELLKATSNTNFYRQLRGVEQQLFRFPTTGSVELSLGDILSRIPHLDRIYSQIGLKGALICTAVVEKVSDPNTGAEGRKITVGPSNLRRTEFDDIKQLLVAHGGCLLEKSTVSVFLLLPWGRWIKSNAGSFNNGWIAGLGGFCRTYETVWGWWKIDAVRLTAFTRDCLFFGNVSEILSLRMGRAC
jgi:hypothetical protein